MIYNRRALLLLNGHYHGIGGPSAIPAGVRHIRELLVPGTYIEVIPAETATWQTRQGVVALDAIEHHAGRVLKLLRESSPQTIYNLGGDCGGELGVIAFLNQAAAGRLQVVWFDAHADLNTPESSPSGNFHGMVLRTLCGEGPARLVQLVPTPLDTRRIVFVGLRSIDPEEERFIAANHIRIAPPGADLTPFLNIADPVYVHVDYDTLDGDQHFHSSYPEPAGLSLDELVEAIARLRSHCRIVGMSLTEYAPTGVGDIASIRALLGAFDVRQSIRAHQ